MRHIDADALEESLKELRDRCKKWDQVTIALTECIIRVIEMPTIEPEQKHGKWIVDGHHIRCNVCETYMCDTDREGDLIPQKFCPNCGTKMEVEG